MKRLTSPRAGRPENARVTRVSSSRACRSARLYAAGMPASSTVRNAGTHLDAGRAERERGGDSAPIHDAAGGEHRHAHRVDDLRHERHAADEPRLERLGEGAPVRARLAALRDDRVDAIALEHQRFRHGGRRAGDAQPARVSRLHGAVGQSSHREAEHARAAVEAGGEERVEVVGHARGYRRGRQVEGRVDRREVRNRGVERRTRTGRRRREQVSRRTAASVRARTSRAASRTWSALV
jgi:hypothetical protein